MQFPVHCERPNVSPDYRTLAFRAPALGVDGAVLAEQGGGMVAGAGLAARTEGAAPMVRIKRWCRRCGAITLHAAAGVPRPPRRRSPFRPLARLMRLIGRLVDRPECLACPWRRAREPGAGDRR